MRRDPAGKLLLVLLIIVLSGVAAITRVPDAPLVHSVSRWPVLGPTIERFANLYRQQEVPTEKALARTASGDEVEVVFELDVAAYEARPWVWAVPGTVFFSIPSLDAERLDVVGSYTNLPIFERRGDWYRVRFQGEKGWLHLPGYEEPTEPPLGSAPDLVLPVPSRPPDPEVLSAALGVFDLELEARQLGPHVFYSDIEDRALVSFLARIVGQVEDAYRNRYGLTPLAGAEEAIVLFEERDRYLVFQQAVPGIADAAAPGVVHGGVVATFAEGRERAEIASTLVHELTHLLNRRALGPALPPWLEEGLADDMGQSRIDEQGRLSPGHLGGSFRREGLDLIWRGGRASAIELERELGSERLPTSEELVALDWPSFMEGEARTLRYSQSSFLIRSLLDSPDPRLAAGFRSFLAAVAAGQPLTPERLREELGRSWSALDARLASFVRLQVMEEGVPAESDSSSSSRQANEPSE